MSLPGVRQGAPPTPGSEFLGVLLQVSVCSRGEDLGGVLAHRGGVSDDAAQADLSGPGKAGPAVHEIRLPAIKGRNKKKKKITRLLCVYINEIMKDFEKKQTLAVDLYYFNFIYTSRFCSIFRKTRRN